MINPLVTIVCLCYNHQKFVREALASVFQQTYKSIQVIVVDDASTDESVKEIKVILPNEIVFISLDNNVGNCKAFNKAMALAKGKYIIDFATDDVMYPDRVEKQVNFFESLSDEYGIIFSDSVYMDQNGEFLRNHTEYLIQKGFIDHVPQGDVFADVLRRYFISTPSMMIKTEVLKNMGGYDEELTYEDFDLWVRASRNYKFGYQSEKLTKVRKTWGSMSSNLYSKADPQLLSTYRICLKAKALLKSDEEKDALISRIRYELRQTVFSENKAAANLYYQLLGELTKYSFLDRTLIALNNLYLPLATLRNLYYRLKYS